ncbi:UNVERIFIED_CONTAM: hypothetical protein Sindi_2630500 [Sesamum indicum]
MRQTSRRRMVVLCFVVAFGQLMATAGAQNRTSNANANANTTDPLEDIKFKLEPVAHKLTSSWSLKS